MPIQRRSAAEQIADELRSDIAARRLTPGARLPSDQALAKRFAVSKPTVTKARAMLVALRLVDSRAGAASVVRDTSRDGVLAPSRVQHARRTGRVYPDGHYARILSARVQPATPEIASALGLEAGASTIARHRVICAADDQPLAESISHFPGELAESCWALLETDRIPMGTTVYIEQQTTKLAASITSAVWCQPAGPVPGNGTERLRLPAGAYVLAVSTTTCDQDGAVVAHEIEFHPPNTQIPLDPVAI